MTPNIDRIDEFNPLNFVKHPYDTAAAAKTNAAGLGNRIYNATLATMGSAKAQGRLDLHQTTSKLTRDYLEFLGRNPGSFASVQSVADYINRAYGPQYASLIANAASATSVGGATPTAGTAPAGAAAPGGKTRIEPTLGRAPNPEVAARKKAMADRKSAGTATRNPSLDAYQNQTMSQIMQAVRAPKPNNGQILSLAKELIAHAKDYGGRDKDRVKMFLNTMRKNPAVMNNPKLAQFLRGNFLESVQRAFDLALFLVEHRDSPKNVLRESINTFLREGVMRIDERPVGAREPTFGPSPTATTAAPARAAPAAAAPDAEAPASVVAGLSNAKISRGQLTRLMQGVAQALLNNGAVTFNSAKKTTNPMGGGDHSGGGEAEPSADPSVAPGAATDGTGVLSVALDPDKLREMLGKVKVDPVAIKAMMSKVRPGSTIQNVLAGMRSATVTPDTAIGLVSAASGRNVDAVFAMRIDPDKLKPALGNNKVVGDYERQLLKWSESRQTFRQFVQGANSRKEQIPANALLSILQSLD